MEIDLDYEAEKLANKTKHYLITTMGRLPDEANDDDFYCALSYALRELVMINWQATANTQTHRDVRTLYYLSMEYLPGRILSNNIANLGSQEIVKLVMHKLNRSYYDIICREPDPGLGGGGLGRLASCLMDSLATHHYPAQAYGLRYHYGTFQQELWNGVQIETPDLWLLRENPWEFRRDLRRVIVKFGGRPISSTNIHGDDIQQLRDFEEVWALPYDTPIAGYGPDNKFSVLTMRLWSTKDSPRNFHLQRFNAGRLDQAAENTTLTNVLYPSDHHETGKRIRLKQEFLLVSASLQDIIRHYLNNHSNFRAFADKVRIQINDTHPSLVIAELIRLLITQYDIPWNKALDITQECCGYTNHTILREALEEWEVDLMSSLLPRQYKVIERINQDFCQTVRKRFPNDEDKIRRISIIERGKVRMANLAIAGSHRINGVAAIHSDILKNQVFKDFYDIYPDRFINVTNGVTQRRWLLQANPDLSKFINRRIGDGWIIDFPQIHRLADYASEPASLDEFLNIKKRNKQRLIDYIKKENMLRDNNGEVIGPSSPIDVQTLFDVQVKRIHEYKRQLMNILHLIMLYHEMKDAPNNHGRTPRTAIFAGKAAAQYETAKEIIRLISCVARKVNSDRDIRGALKIIYIENYNVSKAEIIIPAADLSEQISTAGTEASGTGNMKLTINGALTIGTDDGANIEMRQEITDKWWPFSFGCSAEEIHKMQAENSYHAQEMLANPKIRRAVDTLQNRTFAETEEEHFAFSDLYRKLTESHYGGPPDRYFTLKDLESYYHAQKKVDEFYSQPFKWAEYAIHNIAGMGQFSTDISIENYTKLVWGLSPCPVDEDILERISKEYAGVSV